MQSRSWTMTIAAAAVLALPVMAVGQPQQHQCARCASSPCCAQENHDHAAAPSEDAADYDLALERRFTGVVISAVELPGSGEMLVTISTGENSFEVQVGPSAWMADKGYSFVQGEGVEILGALVPSEGNDTIVARQIWKGGEEMRLRDRNGRPLWTTRQPS